jgi:hypothetical protein
MALTPKAGRPLGPEGYFRARPIPWPWAEKRLREAHNYWIASTTASGHPHSRPVWGVWLEDGLFFDTGSRIGTHLVQRPNVTAHLESGDEVVIIEGIARQVNHEPEAVARFIAAYNAKYAIQLNAPPGALFHVSPRLAFGWVSDPDGWDGGAIYGSTGTRWEFA